MFDPATNNLCSIPFSSCRALEMRAELPTNSLPNWLALHTAALPAAHGYLGNRATPATALESIAAIAAAHGVHTGLSGSPWFVNPVKRHLPMLDGDGRVSSSADDTYETTAYKTTQELDDARWNATLRAAELAAASTPDPVKFAPSRYPLFMAQFTDIDTQGHTYGGVSPQYETACRRAAEFTKQLMNLLPRNSVLLVLSDHGHEDGGGAGGGAAVVQRLPLYIYRKTVQFGTSQQSLNAFTGEEMPDGNTHGDPDVSMVDVVRCLPLPPAPSAPTATRRAS